MSSLKHTDKVKVEAFLGMSGGYVCDFSDSTFKDFVFESTSIDIYRSGYDSNGTSKANRLRLFWKTEPDHTVAKLLKELLEYWRTVKTVSLRNYSDSDEKLYLECIMVVSALENQTKLQLTGEYSLERKMVGVLLSKGYPEESLIFGWEQDGEKFSLAVVEPSSKRLLAVFECLLSSPVVVTSEGIRKVINKYRVLNSDPKVPLYIVHAVKGGYQFSVTKIIYQTKESGLPHYLEVKELLDYKTLKNNIMQVTDKTDNYSEMTDEELEGIVRQHENPDVQSSRFNRALVELDLRYKKRGLSPSVKFEVGGDFTMSDSVIALGDRNHTKVKNDLSKKSYSQKEHGDWFSMNNPFVHILVFLILAGIAYVANQYNLPLKSSL